MAFAGSRPVDVCLQTIYGLDSGVFLSTLLRLCLVLTVAWFGTLSRVCLHAYLPRLLCFSALRDMCICMLSVISPSLRDGLFFTTNRDTEAP